MRPASSIVTSAERLPVPAGARTLPASETTTHVGKSWGRVSGPGLGR